MKKRFGAEHTYHTCVAWRWCCLATCALACVVFVCAGSFGKSCVGNTAAAALSVYINIVKSFWRLLVLSALCVPLAVAALVAALIFDLVLYVTYTPLAGELVHEGGDEGHLGDQEDPRRARHGCQVGEAVENLAAV